MTFHKAKFEKKRAFTLTELLLAVAVVGIIAALVLPATISKFNTTVLKNGIERQELAIKTAIDSLIVTENKSHFGQTSMYSSDTSSYENSSGKFIKRYLRVSKYYGDAAANRDLIVSEGFAPYYYEYEEGTNVRKEITVDDLIMGACAKLKNGATICLAPQSGTSSIHGIIDINGKKGPNIVGRDLSDINLGSMTFDKIEDRINGDVVGDVATTDNPLLADKEPSSDCDATNFTTDCCLARKDTITSASDGCCQNNAVASQIAACSEEIVLLFNFYPTSSCSYAAWRMNLCKPYVSNQSTYAHKKGETSRLNALPAQPPPVYLYCNAVRSGELSSAAVQNAVINPTSNTYFTILSFGSGSGNNGNHYGQQNNSRCDYDSATKGVVSGQGSLAFSNGLDSINYGGVKWWVEKY
ncbi:type II secretion system protein [bacterium]|nr:type II secretion system protein [bacterium]